MSLTDLLSDDQTRYEARAILDDLLPEYARSSGVGLLVERSSPHPTLVGTAFDYAARMEIQHLNGGSSTEFWVADATVDLLPRRSRARRKATDVVRNARLAAAHWPKDTSTRHVEIGAHAARLCQLDVVLRAGLPPTFGEADGISENEIASEVVRLLACAEPLWRLVATQQVCLNPTFGVASFAVGGADADLIVGDTLIEIKTTQAGKIERDHMRQLIGYVCLAYAAGVCAVQKVSVYLSRHGALREFPLKNGIGPAAYVDAAVRLGDLWHQRRAA